MLAQLHLAFAGGSTGHRGARNDTWAKLHATTDMWHDTVLQKNKLRICMYIHMLYVCNAYTGAKNMALRRDMVTGSLIAQLVSAFHLSSFHILSNSATGWTGHCTLANFSVVLVSRT